jgi:hypothetical protein
MNDDIVTRLRGAADRKYGCGCVKCEAAAEIERLRSNVGCARNQRSTQFCAEALDAQRDVETMKAELARNADECRETLTELRQRVETLTAERDEARRMFCRMMSNNSRLEFTTPEWFAEDEGWDCFKEPAHAP